LEKPVTNLRENAGRNDTVHVSVWHRKGTRCTRCFALFGCLSILCAKVVVVTSVAFYTVHPKNVIILSHYNSDSHESILVISGTSITEKVGNRKVPTFSVTFVPKIVKIDSCVSGVIARPSSNIFVGTQCSSCSNYRCTECTVQASL